MFPRLGRPVDLEEEVLAFWDASRIFQRSLERSADKPSWVFYEGPPTANGTPHNGHVLTRVMKDVFPRFQTMRGYRVDRKAGWDTHGLPVEVEVEKLLDVHGKEAIQAYGLEKFNRACVDNVFTYISEWDELTRNVGFWVDLKDPYVTFHRKYVESVWWALSRLFEKGLLYQGHKVVWWWPQGGTTLSAGEVGLGYKTVDDPAVTVRFRDADDPSVSYLAWTTTPWTLPSNVALAVGEKYQYAECADPAGGTVILAADLAQAYGLEPIRTFPATDLVGKRYTPAFDFGAPEGGESFHIVLGHHVTTKSGTGLVHIAPAYGEDDMAIAKAQGLGMLQWVGASGKFIAGTGSLEGQFCKDADKGIIRDLKERGLLFKRDTVRHEYPFCWRADDDPLIQFARPAWFVRTTSKIEGALQNNQSVNWAPEHIKDGRFGDFLRNNVDWALSRERFWGTPLNIWTCGDCEHRVCPSSTQQLREWGATGFAEDVDDNLQIHRPWIDNVTLPCTECGGKMERVPEVIDCWFDSGCMPFAQWGYPHQGEDAFKRSFPADFICEAVDQTRGWFYSLLMISTLLFDDDSCQELGLEPVGFPRPYKSCVVLGHVTDRNGYKESKSKGNYTSPNLVMRGITRLKVLERDDLSAGEVGLLKAQIDSLELGKAKVALSAARDAEPAVSASMKAVKGLPKDTVGLCAADLAALGLSSGDSLWFRIPVDPPGADAFRWLFCSAGAPWVNTRNSFRAIREGQREFLLRLRNVYQFFTIYANISLEKGQFDPSGSAPRSPAERSDLDRWILHRLHATIGTVTENLDRYRLFEASRELLTFVDDLSNWYVRRSRARFWGEGDDLQDALWTLYEVLRTFSKVIAPFVPFHAEALFRALEGVAGADAETSVHLNDWPDADASLLDQSLADDMALARSVVSLGLSARAAAKIKVRQPLHAATIVLADASQQAAVDKLSSWILDELNVRTLEFATDAADLVAFKVKPDFKKLGPKLGKGVKEVAGLLARMDGAEIKRQLDGEGLTLTLSSGASVTLSSDDVMVTVEAQGDYEAASAPEAVVAIAKTLDDDLLAEGMIRELVNRVQNLRKEENLGFTDRIRLHLAADDTIRAALDQHGEMLTRETLAVALEVSDDLPGDGWIAREWEVEGRTVHGRMAKAT